MTLSELNKKGYRLSDLVSLMRSFEKRNLNFLKTSKCRDLSPCEDKEWRMVCRVWDQLNTKYQKLKVEELNYAG